MQEKHYKLSLTKWYMNGFGKKRGYLSGKRGQIWMETVIYTLIAFSLMGLVLSFVLPKIQQSEEKSTIDQSVSILQNIDSTINNIGSPGNQRVLSIGINKGTMTIDPANNRIFFVIESNQEYSEPGENVSVGKITADTETLNSAYTVTLSLEYSGEYNLTYAGAKSSEALTSSSTPYSLTISNAGTDSSGNTIINMEVTG